MKVEGWERESEFKIQCSVVNVCFELFYRIKQAIEEHAPVVDVDGSYLYRKHQRLFESGFKVAPLDVPCPPITGWECITDENVCSVAPKVPRVTSGVFMRCFA